MTHPLAKVDGARAMIPTVLGQSAQRIPTGGKIRAGIKVLTKKAAEHQKARELYERGVEAGHSFERIETEISQAIPELKTPLVPKNAPYFTVRGEDFPNPEIARQILEANGEDRGDGVVRLYRFPVVFPADAWQTVMPHELVCWGSNEKKFWSEYSEDGRTRYCKCYAPVPRASSGQRAIRIFGGRKATLRDDNSGLCDPEACPEYQDRRCNLSGRFIFFVPGIKSINAFELITHSFYAMNAAIQRFQTIGFMRGGRISGFLDGQRTPFYLAKKLMEVPHIDEQGRAVRVKQWIIDLEAPIDVTALLRPDEGVEALSDRANEAVAVLEGCAGARHLEGTEVFDMPTKPAAPPAQPVADKPEGVPRPAAPPSPAAAEKRSDVGRGATSDDEVGAIYAEAANLGVPEPAFEKYAEKRWGRGWKLNASGRKRARDEVRGFAQDAPGFKAKVDAEMNVFS